MDFASLQHSVFLQVLGSAILNSLWQSFILWFLYETVSISYKSSSARFKNNLSTILLFFSFIWFVTTFILKIINYQAGTSARVDTSFIGGQSAIHSISAVEKFLNYAGSSLPYLSVAYIFLLFLLIAKLFTAYRYVYIVSNKRLVTPPLELQTFASEVAFQMGIPGKITVWISNHIDVPATIGFIKPLILIPVASLNNLSGEQLEAIILHELSHIKRNDYFINIIISVIETILFFNPFVALLSKVIKRERENCCDDFVLQYQYDPHSYASALLRLEQSRVNTLKLAIGAVSGKKQLLSRIKRITNGQAAVKQFNYGHKLLALLFITVVICSIAWLSPGGKKQFSTKALQKDVGVVTLQKTSLSPKSLGTTDEQIEDVTTKILKRVLTKKGPDALNEPDQQEFHTLENEKLAGFANPPARFQDFASLPANIQLPRFFFDETKLKLPPSVNIKDFPFKNMSFNIDLGNIDVGKLNENLNRAYSQIDAINWGEVQHDIRESFSKQNFGNFPSKKEFEFYIAEAKNLAPLKEDVQRNNIRIVEENLGGEIRKRDSLSRRQMEFDYENSDKIQEQYKKIQRLYSEIPQLKTYMSYAINSSDNNSAKENTVYVENNKHTSSKDTKSVVITVDRLSKNETLRHHKKLFQFSSGNNSKKTGARNVINIELSDLP